MSSSYPLSMPTSGATGTTFTANASTTISNKDKKSLQKKKKKSGTDNNEALLDGYNPEYI